MMADEMSNSVGDSSWRVKKQPRGSKGPEITQISPADQKEGHEK